MLEVYSNNITTTAGEALPFNSVALRKGATAVLSGASSIELNKRGVYSVSAVLTGLPDDAGAAVLTMTKDGTAQPQATATVPDAVTTTGVTLVINTLVQVPEDNSLCCCDAPTVLQFINSGVALTDASICVTVTKVC